MDIATEASVMASYSAAPRKGHLDALFHMFAYLNLHERSTMVFDPEHVQHAEVAKPDWSEFYRDTIVEVPPDAPEPRGKPVQITGFVDSDHAGDKVTHRSRSGILVCANKAPIIWTSEKQGSVKSSSFGSEFSAMKLGVETIKGLRYKLIMMGCPLDGPAHIKADNMSVIKNSSQPESTLNKKSNSIAFHCVRERAACGMIVVTCEPTKSNLADLLTKLQSGPERQRLVRLILH